MGCVRVIQWLLGVPGGSSQQRASVRELENPFLPCFEWSGMWRCFPPVLQCDVWLLVLRASGLRTRCALFSCQLYELVHLVCSCETDDTWCA